MVYILVLGTWRQKDHEFKGSLRDIVETMSGVRERVKEAVGTSSTFMKSLGYRKKRTKDPF